MEDSNLSQNSLLFWIDPYSQEQISWIASYISKKNLSAALFGDSFHASPFNIINFLYNNQHDARYRELTKEMRNAWNQKKYRERNGKQVSFQLPNNVAKSLEKIAKRNNQSKTQALCDIIKNTEKQRQHENKKHKEQIEKLQNEKYNVETRRNRAIDTLSKFLVEEIVNRCKHESTTGAPQEKELVLNRIEEIENSTLEMKTLRAAAPDLRSYLPYYK